MLSPPTRECVVCGRTFEKPPACGMPEWERARKTCSMTCRNVWMKGRTHTEAHRRNAAKARTGLKRTPEQCERIRAGTRAYWADHDHPDKGKTRDPELVARIAAILYKGGRKPWPVEKRREVRRRYHARKMLAFVEDVREDVLLQRDSGLCGICGAPIDPNRFEIDHVIPLSRGGEHSYANTQLAHPTCNKRKGARVGFVLTDV